MLLEIKDLHAFYEESHVLRGISLNVDHGEIVSLLGRNGVGKTTTLKSIIGLLAPRSGQVLFKDRNISGLAPHTIANLGVGYVPEERRIFPRLTVRENLLMGIKPGQKETENGWSVEKIYDYFPHLKARDRQKGAYLSGGEQQMLTIGRALMGNPGLLLVDEPTEGLAPLMVQEVRDILEELNKKVGVSILLVEHNVSVAMSLATRIYLMGKAHIGFSGTKEELEANSEVRAKYLEV